MLNSHLISLWITIRALPSGVPNAKYLDFGTPNTKNQSSSGTSNLKHFTTPLQYRLKYETIWTSMPKKKICLFYLLFSLLPTHISLSSSATSLLSGLHLSRCSLFLSHSHFFFLSLTLFLSRPHSTPPTSSHCRAADLAWSSHPLISSSLYSATPRRSLSLSLLMFGCFDCWWLADFGWWW